MRKFDKRGIEMKDTKEKLSINDEFRFLYIVILHEGDNLAEKDYHENPEEYKNTLDLWIECIFSINHMIPEIVDTMIHMIDSINKRKSYDKNDVECMYVHSMFELIMNLPETIDRLSKAIGEKVNDISIGSRILNGKVYSETNVKLIKSSTYYDSMAKIHDMYEDDEKK